MLSAFQHCSCIYFLKFIVNGVDVIFQIATFFNKKRKMFYPFGMLAAFVGTNMWCLWAGNLRYLSAIYTLQVSDCVGILIYHIYEGKYMVRAFGTSNLCIFLATSLISIFVLIFVTDAFT